MFECFNNSIYVCVSKWVVFTMIILFWKIDMIGNRGRR